MSDREARAREIVEKILDEWDGEYLIAHEGPPPGRYAGYGQELIDAIVPEILNAYQRGRREGLEDAAKKLERCGCVHISCTADAAEAIRALAEGEK